MPCGILFREQSGQTVGRGERPSRWIAGMFHSLKEQLDSRDSPGCESVDFVSQRGSTNSLIDASISLQLRQQTGSQRPTQRQEGSKL